MLPKLRQLYVITLRQGESKWEYVANVAAPSALWRIVGFGQTRYFLVHLRVFRAPSGRYATSRDVSPMIVTDAEKMVRDSG
jgi:hypothetical protein